jgi:hypothetical protein
MRSLAALLLTAGATLTLTPAAHAEECREAFEGQCELRDKTCGYGSSLEQKFGVGWSCTQ